MSTHKIDSLEKKLAYLKEKKEQENQTLIDKYMNNNNLSDYASPYFYNKDSEAILKYILGQRQMDDIIKLNALAHSGVINVSCPPPNAPENTEEFINVLTGKKECREPIPDRKQLSGPMECGNLKSEDPLATEKYIDFFGRAHCQRPVLSGAFSCPPKGDPNKLKRIVLKNNVGICVEDPIMKKGNKNFIMPAQLVYYNDEVNSKMAQMLNYLNSMRFSSDTLLRLGNILKYQKSVSDIKSGLSRDPEYELLALIANNLNKPEDVHIAKSTYIHHLIKTNPELASELLSDGGNQITTDSLKNFLGVEIGL